MKIILRKKFVLLKTFWEPRVSDPIQTVRFAASAREPLSAWRDRKKDITESLETSLVHQSSTPASGTTFERPGRACSHRNISNLFHISQDTMVPLISGLLTFEESDFIKQPIVLCRPWRNSTPWDVIIFLPFSSSKLIHSYLLSMYLKTEYRAGARCIVMSKTTVLCPLEFYGGGGGDTDINSEREY